MKKIEIIWSDGHKTIEEYKPTKNIDAEGVFKALKCFHDYLERTTGVTMESYKEIG